MKTNKYTIIFVSFLIIGCFLSPMFAQGKSTKLVFDAIEWTEPSLVPPAPTIIFFEDGIMHIKDYWSMHLLGGTIGDDVISGWTKSLFHAKIDLATGNLVVNGQTWFYMTWGELTGYFTGTVNAKKVGGVLTGMYTLKGYEDFDGMKLFGTLWNIDATTNGLDGTVLIPN